MSEQNRALATRWMDEVWNQRREETVGELLSPDAVGHIEGGEVRGAAAFLAYRAQLLSAFPDLRVTIEAMVSDGEIVVVRWRVDGTHHGEGLGFPGTGRTVSFDGITWMVFRDGLLVEGWDRWNQGALMTSLVAALPPAAGSLF